MNILIEPELKSPVLLVSGEDKASSAVSPVPLLGTWTNIDSDPRDLAMLLVASRGSAITVEVFGIGAFTPCDWGPVTGIAYAANRSGSPTVAFSAQYTFSVSHVILIGHLLGNQLVVETFTQFTDDSGRANLYTADTLTR